MVLYPLQSPPPQPQTTMMGVFQVGIALPMTKKEPTAKWSQKIPHAKLIPFLVMGIRMPIQGAEKVKTRML